MIHRWPITPDASRAPPEPIFRSSAGWKINLPTWHPGPEPPHTNISAGQRVASPPTTHPSASGLVQSPEGLAVPPARLLYPKTRWSALRVRPGLTKNGRPTPDLGKHWQGGGNLLWVPAAQLAHSPGGHLTPNPHVVPSKQLAQVL